MSKPTISVSALMAVLAPKANAGRGCRSATQLAKIFKRKIRTMRDILHRMESNNVVVRVSSKAYGRGPAVLFAIPGREDDRVSDADWATLVKTYDQPTVEDMRKRGWITLREAADHLGMSYDGTRQRIRKALKDNPDSLETTAVPCVNRNGTISVTTFIRFTK